MKEFCLDPMKRHKKQISSGLRKISETLFIACKGKLDRSAILCSNCRREITKNPGLLPEDDSTTSEGNESESADNNESSSDDNPEEVEKYPNLVSVLKELDVTPIRKRKYMYQYFKVGEFQKHLVTF